MIKNLFGISIVKKENYVTSYYQSTSNRVGDEILVFSNRLEFQDSLEELNSPMMF